MTYENNMTQIGYATYVKEIGKMVSISLGVGSKQADGQYKTGFLEIRGSKDVLGEVVKGDKIKVKGFLSFNFWIQKETEKEMQKPIMVVNELLETEKKDGETATSKTEKKDTGNKATVKKETEKKEPVKKEKEVQEEVLPEIDVDDEFIPF